MSDITEGLNLPRIQQKATDGQEELTIAIYNGRLGFTIFGQPGKPPAWRESLGLDFALMFEQLLGSIVAAQPGTKHSLMFQTFDKETKKSSVTSVLVVG